MWDDCTHTAIISELVYKYVESDFPPDREIKLESPALKTILNVDLRDHKHSFVESFSGKTSSR